MENKSWQSQISYRALRRCIGYAAILLPVVLISGSIISHGYVRNSISDYYYTGFTSYFTGTLCAISLFLFTYRGYEAEDLLLSRIMSLLMIVIVFNPCHSQDINYQYNIIRVDSNGLQNWVHNIAAIIFFLCCAYYSMFLFTKTDGKITKRKVKRNSVYTVCGFIILFSLTSIIISAAVFKIQWAILIFESLILWSFGFNWLVKGGFILKDINY